MQTLQIVNSLVNVLLIGEIASIVGMITLAFYAIMKQSKRA